MRDLDLGYVGVLVDDRDPQAIFDQMLTSMRNTLPGWTPRNASLDVAILEAFAVAAADWIYATNRTVGALVEALVAIDGVPRDEGTPGTGQATLTFDGAVALTVGEGDAFITATGATLLAVRDTTISGTSGLVDVEEAEPGSTALLPAGTVLSPAVGIPRLSTCTLTTPVTGGRPAEDDLSWITRASLRRRRISNALVLPDDFTAAALEDPRVGRATTINRWNSDTSTTVNGHATVALYGRGAALPAEVLSDLTDVLTSACYSELTLHVIDAELAPVNITAGITVAPGYTSGDVIDACEDAITAWLGWDNAGFAQTVTPTAIETLLKAVPGVSTAAVTAPTGDVTCQAWELPSPGTLNIHT